MLKVKQPTWVEEPQHTLPFFDPRMVCHSKDQCLPSSNVSNKKKEIIKLKKTRPCWNCGKTSRCSRKCNEEKKTLEKKEETTFMIKGKTHQTFTALTLGHCSNNWYMDSCCSQHMS
jgi:hypothetical protein